MSRPTLAIVVPTFNRVRELRGLLETLVEEFPAEPDVLTILVADNCSTDATAEVLEEDFKGILPLTVHRHETNIGAAANVGWLFENAPDADYLWCLCDDDRPATGSLEPIIELLRERKPAWVHLPHYWIGSNGEPTSGSPVPDRMLEFEGAGELFRSCHHWLTFASASIVDRDRACRSAIENPTSNAYPHLVWWTLGCLDGLCLVPAFYLVYGSAAISWADRRSEILCRDFPGLYEDALHAAVSRSEFAAALDILFEPTEVLSIWAERPLEELIETVERFPQSRRLRGAAWDFARHYRDEEAVRRLRACEDAEASQAAEVALAAGEQAFSAGDIVEAERQFGMALVELPTLPRAWNNLGVVFHATGRTSAAVEAFRNALLLDPGYEDAKLNLADVQA